MPSRNHHHADISNTHHSTDIFPSALINDIAKARQQQENQVKEQPTPEGASASPLDPSPTDLSKLQETIHLELNKERVAEQKQRRRFRISMFICFFILLLLQHIGLAVLIYFSIKKSLIAEIQPLLEIIISATLAETYAIIRIMVKFVFSPGDFDDKKQKREIR